MNINCENFYYIFFCNNGKIKGISLPYQKYQKLGNSFYLTNNVLLLLNLLFPTYS